jgi:4'-phosphopantetheinyl transferase
MSTTCPVVGGIRSVFVDLDAAEVVQAFLHSPLSAKELARAGECCRRRDRERFIVRRSVLRLLLSGYLSCRPGEIDFLEDRGGKPYVEVPAAGPAIHFSVSHRGGIAAFAFASDGRVGIDIEKVDGSVECLEIARRFFTTWEAAQIAALAPPEQVEAFFTCWTRKEAYVKAAGIQPFDSFDVALAGNGVVNRLRPQENGRWTVESLEAPEGYKCSLASRRDEGRRPAAQRVTDYEP